MARQTPIDALIGGFMSQLMRSGEGAFNKLSEQLLENPVFMEALRHTLEAKGQVDRTIRDTMDFVSLPSKNDIERIVELLEKIDERLGSEQRSLQAMEEQIAVMKLLVEHSAVAASRRSSTAKRRPIRKKGSR